LQMQLFFERSEQDEKNESNVQWRNIRV
jgi:hypothetical protein